MKRSLILLVASFAATVAMVSAQDTKDKNPPEVTITGCLIQGSGSTVFLLDNARMNPQDKDEKAQRYKISGTVSNADLSQQVNHEVSISGKAEMKVVPVPPAGAMVAEKDLPKLEARTLTSVADTCSPHAR